MNILVCNAGSTSLKFKLISFPSREVLIEARMERIGEEKSKARFVTKEGTFLEEGIPSYRAGIERFLAVLNERNGGKIGAVGFKTVLSKGYCGVHLIDGKVLRGMEEYLDVAPSHNRSYIEAVKLFHDLLPDTPLVGVFETAFHTEISLARSLYALPYEWYETYGLKKYGYHGASHAYIAKTLREKLGYDGRILSFHLGGSSSVCAIEHGRSADTSFGMSLQTGMPHAARCGDVDPFVLPFLKNRGMSEEEILRGMTENGGLKGISGIGGDMRDIEEAARNGDGRARLAIEVFVTAAVRYGGAFFAELGGFDAVAFTGGIGENSSHVRGKICRGLSALGVRISAKKNGVPKEYGGLISRADSRIKVYVIPADEESIVAERTYEIVSVPVRQ